jgi:hypothetical protein
VNWIGSSKAILPYGQGKPLGSEIWIESDRLAFDDAGEPVGIVSDLVLEFGRDYVWFVGVVDASRGRGCPHELLA